MKRSSAPHLQAANMRSRSWCVGTRRAFSAPALVFRGTRQQMDISHRKSSFERGASCRASAATLRLNIGWRGSRVTTCYDFLRRERRHQGHVSLDEFPIEMRDSGIDGAIASGHARELLDWAMQRLSAQERLIITLLESRPRPVPEIAEHTGWSESNVKVRAFRARARLREILNHGHES